MEREAGHTMAEAAVGIAECHACGGTFEPNEEIFFLSARPVCRECLNAIGSATTRASLLRKSGLIQTLLSAMMMTLPVCSGWLIFVSPFNGTTPSVADFASVTSYGQQLKGNVLAALHEIRVGLMHDRGFWVSRDDVSLYNLPKRLSYLESLLRLLDDPTVKDRGLLRNRERELQQIHPDNVHLALKLVHAQRWVARGYPFPTAMSAVLVITCLAICVLYATAAAALGFTFTAQVLRICSALSLAHCFAALILVLFSVLTFLFWGQLGADIEEIAVPYALGGGPRAIAPAWWRTALILYSPVALILSMMLWMACNMATPRRAVFVKELELEATKS